MRGVQTDPEGVELTVFDRLFPLAGKRLLEIGCGDGRLTASLAERARGGGALDPDRRGGGGGRAPRRRGRRRAPPDPAQAVAETGAVRGGPGRIAAVRRRSL